MASVSKYSIEIWSSNGQLLADLSGQARDIRIVKSRNAADDITFTLDLNKFEDYCRKLAIDPKLILVEGSSEIRVKRLGTYVSGGQLTYKEASLTPNDERVSCHVRGFFWLFTSRLTGSSASGGVQGNVSENYLSSNNTNLSRKDLAWSLIQQTQALSNGNFGITRGLTGGSDTKYEKQYTRSTIADALTNISQLVTDPIDYEFTADKVFNTYASIGSNRPDIVFEYPSPKVLTMNASYDTEEQANEIIGLSQIAIDTNGNQSQYTYYAENIGSQANYGLRQQQFNSDAVDDTKGGLTDGTTALLNAKSAPIILPSITIDGNRFPTITDFGIGDRVGVKVNNHPLLNNINGMYRIEKFTLTIDEGENEVIAPEFSNLGISTNTAEYDAGNALVREIQSLRADVNRIRTVKQ